MVLLYRVVLMVLIRLSAALSDETMTRDDGSSLETGHWQHELLLVFFGRTVCGRDSLPHAESVNRWMT